MDAMNIEIAQRFADAWVADWNSHDLDRILSHYTDDFEMTSPAISVTGFGDSGKLEGKSNVGDYWRAALDRVPDLLFTLKGVFCGVNSVVIYYEGPLGMGAEVFEFNEDGKVFRAFANYEGFIAAISKLAG